MPSQGHVLEFCSTVVLVAVTITCSCAATTNSPASGISAVTSNLHSHHNEPPPVLTEADKGPHHDHPDVMFKTNLTTVVIVPQPGNNTFTFSEEDWPQWKRVLDFITTIVLTCNTITLMLGMGCATYWKDVVNHTWPPTGIVIGMVGQFIMLPALGSLLSYIFGLTRYEAMGVLMVSCSPGGSFSNFFTFWVDGDLALSIVMTTFSSVLAFGGMPFNLWLYSKIWIDASEVTPLVIPYSSILTALLFITIPVAIGMVIRHFSLRISKMITKVASILGWLGSAAVITIWLILYWQVFVQATPLIYLSAVLLPVMGFCVAYGFAKILCRSHKVCRTIGIETGSQNMVVALSIILLTFKEPSVKASMLLFPTLYGITLLLEMFLGIGIYQAWKKYFKKTKEEDKYPPTYTASVERGAPNEKQPFQLSQKV